jgi:hypothetical protein
MRARPRSALLVAACATILAGPTARPVTAQEPPADGSTGAPVIVAPIPAATPATDDEAHVRELNERLFTTKALAMDGSRVRRNGLRMDGDTFYRLVGRDDLADQRQTRRILKGVAIGAGATAMTLGFYIAVGEALCVDVCSDRRSRVLPEALLLGGAVAILVGAIFPSDPTGAAEKTGLVDDYNRRLRASLGLTP